MIEEVIEMKKIELQDSVAYFIIFALLMGYTIFVVMFTKSLIDDKTNPKSVKHPIVEHVKLKNNTDRDCTATVIYECK